MSAGVEAIVAEMRAANSVTMRQLADRLQSAHDAEVGALRAFAQDVMEDWHEGDLDGGTRQDLAVKHGLLSVEQRFEPCGEACGCSEYFTAADWALGQDCYRTTPLLTGAAIDRAMEGEDG